MMSRVLVSSFMTRAWYAVSWVPRGNMVWQARWCGKCGRPLASSTRRSSASRHLALLVSRVIKLCYNLSALKCDGVEPSNSRSAHAHIWSSAAFQRLRVHPEHDTCSFIVCHCLSRYPVRARNRHILAKAAPLCQLEAPAFKGRIAIAKHVAWQGDR